MAKLPVKDALLRACCLDAIARYQGAEEENSTLTCGTCTNRMRVHDGFWVYHPHADTRAPQGGRWEETLSAKWNRDQTAK